MANRDMLKDVLSQFQNLKLSSPLRTDQNRDVDDNKENILAGQDISKAKPEQRNQCISVTPVLSTRYQSSPLQTDGSKINGVDASLQNKSEAFTPSPISLKKSFHTVNSDECRSNSVSSEETTSDQFLSHSNNLETTYIYNEVDSNDPTSDVIKEHNSTADSNVIVFDELGEKHLDTAVCIQPNLEDITSSTHSEYADCVAVISTNCSNKLESFSVSTENLNSTFEVEGKELGVKPGTEHLSNKKVDEVPLGEDKAKNVVATECNGTEEIVEYNKPSIKDEVEVLVASEAVPNKENKFFNSLESGENCAASRTSNIIIAPSCVDIKQVLNSLQSEEACKSFTVDNQPIQSSLQSENTENCVVDKDQASNYLGSDKISESCAVGEDKVLSSLKSEKIGVNCADADTCDIEKETNECAVDIRQVLSSLEGVKIVEDCVVPESSQIKLEEKPDSAIADERLLTSLDSENISKSYTDSEKWNSVKVSSSEDAVKNETLVSNKFDETCNLEEATNILQDSSLVENSLKQSSVKNCETINSSSECVPQVTTSDKQDSSEQESTLTAENISSRSSVLEKQDTNVDRLLTEDNNETSCVAAENYEVVQYLQNEIGLKDKEEKLESENIVHTSSIVPQNTDPNLNSVDGSQEGISGTESTENQNSVLHYSCEDRQTFTSCNEECDNDVLRELSFANCTAANSSSEEIDKSTVVLVSPQSSDTYINSHESSKTSLSTSEQTSDIFESPGHNHSATEVNQEDYSEVHKTSTEKNIVQLENSFEQLDKSVTNSDNHIVNKSSSAFIILSSPKAEKNLNQTNPIEHSISQELTKKTPVKKSEADIVNTSEEAITNDVTVQSDLLSHVGALEEAETSNEKQLDEKAAKFSNIPEKVQVHLKEMEDMNENLQQVNSDLKLELNAAKQAKSSLELEIGKKDEIILKTQAEAIRKEQQFQQDIKALKEQLKEKSSLNEKDFIKDLEEALKEAKARESQALSELNARTNDELNYRKIMEEYEKMIATCIADKQKLKEENGTLTRHLANLELSFSDVHQKYERSKIIIDGFKTNEEKLKKKFVVFEDTFHKQEEKYESLKAHAQAQIEKSNKEIMLHREKYDNEVTKLNAIIKRLEIKTAALETSLEQKTQECIALAALCDEVTGKRV